MGRNKAIEIIVASNKRLISYLVVLITFCSYCYGQSNSTDIDLVKALFRSEIANKIDTQKHIFYIESTFRVPGVMEEISSKKSFKDVSGASITLTKNEQKYIIKALESVKEYEWPENLFNNSERIKVEESASFASKYSPIHDSINKKKIIGFNYIYGFSKPIYLREKHIALITYSKLCGAMCGQTEIAFYIFEKDGWRKYVTIGHGVF